MSESRKRKKPSGANATQPKERKAARAKRADPVQQEFPETAEAVPPPQAAPGPAPGAMAPSLAVVELGNTSKGCWKLLADGKRVKLSDQDWRQELARVFSRQQPPS